MSKSGSGTKKAAFSITFLSLLASCGTGKDENNSALTRTSVEWATEGLLSSLGGSLDEFATDGGIFGTNGTANLCGGRLANTAGVCAMNSPPFKTRTYSSCAIDGGFLGNGKITLTYNGVPGNCAYDATHTTLARKIDNGIFGVSNGISSSEESTAHTDYLNASIAGGGLTITYLTATTADLQIGGYRKIYYVVNNGINTTVADLSISSTSTSTLTHANLLRAGRSVSGGVLRVANNTSAVLLEAVPSNLTWSSSCCFPVSGSLAITLTGNVSDSRTITFTGACGAYSETNSDGVTTHMLLSCAG